MLETPDHDYSLVATQAGPRIKSGVTKEGDPYDPVIGVHQGSQIADNRAFDYHFDIR